MMMWYASISVGICWGIYSYIYTYLFVCSSMCDYMRVLSNGLCASSVADGHGRIHGNGRSIPAVTGAAERDLKGGVKPLLSCSPGAPLAPTVPKCAALLKIWAAGALGCDRITTLPPFDPLRKHVGQALASLCLLFTAEFRGHLTDA